MNGWTEEEGRQEVLRVDGWGDGRKKEKRRQAMLGCFPFPEPVLTSDERQRDVVGL